MKKVQEGIQVNKFISSSGFCSRREADEIIAQGRVTINKITVGLGARVRAGDVVAVDGEKIKNAALKQSIYMAFNKPEGITCTTDLGDKTSIISYINYPKRIFPIGRLDKDSEGLILLTNDGDIVNEILRSENEHEKEYIVDLDKPITGEFIRRMSGGMNIDGEKTKSCIVRELGAKRFKIILTQGLNRQIRKMCRQLDYKVINLKRIRIININLDNLPVGKWRLLNPHEMEKLMSKIHNIEMPEKVKPKKEKIKYTSGS